MRLCKTIKERNMRCQRKKDEETTAARRKEQWKRRKNSKRICKMSKCERKEEKAVCIVQ